MNRRDLMTLIGGAAAWPVAARGQQAAMPVIGFLGSAAQEASSDRVRAFRQGLSAAGYLEGRNVAIEFRWGEGHNDRLPALAADLVRRNVNVIVTGGGTPSVLAAKAATKTIPIIFQMGGDPVQMGLVASLSRPGGNLTGTVTLNAETGSKKLELLHELVPTATVVAVLVNPTNPTAAIQSKDLEAAALVLGVQLRVIHASTESELDSAFVDLLQSKAGAIVISGDPFFTSRIDQLAALALRRAIPAIYQFREFAAAGGLMSYGASNTDGFRRSGIYTSRILMGDKPADLPVQQITKIELTINLKTAKAIGLTIPPSLLAIADEVIE